MKDGSAHSRTVQRKDSGHEYDPPRQYKLRSMHVGSFLKGLNEPSVKSLMNEA